MRRRAAWWVGLGVFSVVAACSGNDVATAPAAASFAKGSGGGGTTTPLPPATPTIVVSQTLFAPLAGQQYAINVIATSESGDRLAPTLSLAGAPAGFSAATVVAVDSPHGGGPGYTEASYLWTPTRDQVGLAANITLTATTSGGSSSTVVALLAVVDAPTAPTDLTATLAGDHIEARWDASTGGVGPIVYDVAACYRNANIRPSASTCVPVGTASAPELLDIPAVDATPSVAPAGGVASYFALLVTARDANGTSSAPVLVTVQ